MKTSLPYLLAVGGLSALLLLSHPANTRGDASADSPGAAAAIRDLMAQQETLIANETKIEEKTAQIAEEVRQARLFVSRGGGHK